jgi:glycogen(starch) synthase
MRVLMTTDCVGGVWTYCMELVRALHDIGIETALATMGAPLTAEQARTALAAGVWDLFESDFRLEWMSDPWDDLERAGDWLLDLEREVEPDVVHLNSYVHGALPWANPTLMVGHSCVLSWWQAVKGEAAPAEWDRYRDDVQAGLQAADLVIAPTNAMLSSLTEHYGPFRSAASILNCRDGRQFAPSSGRPQVFSMGRLWDPAKNIAALDEIAPQVGWPVRVAGSAIHPDTGGEVQARNVEMLGPLQPPEVARELTASAVYALPARYEPFGLSILEAALSGCALVVGNIPTLRELWDGAALFVDPDEPQELAEALTRLIEDDVLRASVAQAALQRGRQFMPRRTAEAYADSYAALQRDRSVVPVRAELQEVSV